MQKERNPNRVKINLSALVHNLNMVKKLVGPSTRIMGVVKSDGYGHGLLPVARTLERAGVDCLAVAYIDEAIRLIRGGVELPIVILCGLLPEDVLSTVETGLVPVIFDLDMATRLDLEGRRQNRMVDVFLKVDTGMGRLGISCDRIGAFLEAVVPFKNIRIQGILSHLSSADDPVWAYTEKQLVRFINILYAARSVGLNFHSNSLANSAGIMVDQALHFDMVRPGIMLYGGLPSPDFNAPVSLMPVMSFYGRVLQVRNVPAGVPISYGGTYVTERNSRIAILSAGYGDGLPRSMSGHGHVLVRGCRAPLIGRICMNTCVCDITDMGEVQAGDKVVFMGSFGKESITADDIARWAKTISYEIFCSIGQKNNREYTE